MLSLGYLLTRAGLWDFPPALCFPVVALLCDSGTVVGTCGWGSGLMAFCSAFTPPVRSQGGLIETPASTSQGG